MQDVSGNMTMFVPSTYNANLAERIFYPYCSVSTATAPCPTADQYTWDRATNPGAAIGTGLGGPGNMYPSYIAAGTLIPSSFNGISTGGYSVAPNPYTGMQIATWNNPCLPLQHGVYQVPRFSPAFPLWFRLGRLRKRQDGHPWRLRTESAPGTELISERRCRRSARYLESHSVLRNHRQRRH